MMIFTIFILIFGQSKDYVINMSLKYYNLDVNLYIKLNRIRPIIFMQHSTHIKKILIQIFHNKTWPILNLSILTALLIVFHGTYVRWGFRNLLRTCDEK